MNIINLNEVEKNILPFSELPKNVKDFFFRFCVPEWQNVECYGLETNRNIQLSITKEDIDELEVAYNFIFNNQINFKIKDKIFRHFVLDQFFLYYSVKDYFSINTISSTDFYKINLQNYV